MTTVTVDDVRSFAERVERLCDFILSGLEKDGSDDVVIIQKLQDDAKDLQSITRNSNLERKSNISIEGLSQFLKGAP